MLTSEFNYDLPKELIAQVPPENRGESRLLILHRDTGQLEHRQFFHLPEYLLPGDLLVVNDSKVIPARLYGIREKTGAGIELLLIKRVADNRWLAMAHPGKKTRPGETLSFGEGKLKATVLSIDFDGYRDIEFHFSGTWESVISELGVMPVPPYIKRSPEEKELLHLDKTRYQTVYAESEGSIAAPTAGLHFTNQILSDISSRGIDTAKLTLHVGTGTFLPVKVERVEEHPMHYESYTISRETLEKIQKARERKGKIIAVGTTTTRVLESVAELLLLETPAKRSPIAYSGETNLFIYPGYKFKIIDGLITNFHLPQSTLLMLISAFAGKEKVLNAYQEAVRLKYRFYSYGDCMLIL